MAFLSRLRAALARPFRRSYPPPPPQAAPSARAAPASSAPADPAADAYFADPGHWRPVRSSNVHAVAYYLDAAAPSAAVLGVRFRPDGAPQVSEYRYHGVPLAVFQDLAAAASAGRYTHENLKGRFRCYGPY